MTTANKILRPSAFALVVLAALVASSAHADGGGAASAMFGVKEVIVQFAHFGNSLTAEQCGLSQPDLAEQLVKELVADGVPAVSVAEAKPPIAGVARIDLVPDISTFNSQGLDCTSWLSLSAESRNSVHIPPVDISRNVVISYWREGTLLSTGEATHERTVGSALQKLAHNFAQQYKLDQPPDNQ